MTRRLLIPLVLIGLSLTLALQAAAGTTTVAVSMTFTEPTVYDFQSGCPVLPNGGCGNGVVVPFGHATETIVGGGACGGTCDFRTVNLAGGSIYLDESFSNGTCPGSCQPNRAEPGSGTLTDVVVGGTGMFVGATGNLSGSVTVGGPQAQIKLSGTLTLQS